VGVDSADIDSAHNRTWLRNLPLRSPSLRWKPRYVFAYRGSGCKSRPFNGRFNSRGGYRSRLTGSINLD
jgi:hypothetical protein